jgi:hypothetical protein
LSIFLKIFWNVCVACLAGFRYLVQVEPDLDPAVESGPGPGWTDFTIRDLQNKNVELLTVPLAAANLFQNGVFLHFYNIFRKMCRS